MRKNIRPLCKNDLLNLVLSKLDQFLNHFRAKICENFSFLIHTVHRGKVKATKMFQNSPPFRPFLVKSVPIRPLSGPTAHFFIRPLLSYVAEQSASWQYSLQLCSGMGLFREKGDENDAYQVDISALVGWGRDGEGSS